MTFQKTDFRNEFGVKHQSDCYRTINNVLCRNAQDVVEPGDYETVKQAAQALARSYRDRGFLARIESQYGQFYRVFVDARAFDREGV